MLRKDREKVRYCYPIKGGVFCVFCGCKWTALPLDMARTCKKTASYCLLEMLQNTHKSQENLCFSTEIFCIKISEYKMIY
jgi:hypothetical protein